MIKIFKRVGIIGKLIKRNLQKKNMPKTHKFELEHIEPLPDADTEEITRIILARFGLLPRKSDGIAKMHNLLSEISERKKQSNREKKPELAVLPVEEMALHAGIKRQTMYDYLNRWLKLNILKKTSFVSNGKVIIGYELNGSNLESAFRKAEMAIRNHTEESVELVKRLQNEIKREKLRGENPSETLSNESTQTEDY